MPRILHGDGKTATELIQRGNGINHRGRERLPEPLIIEEVEELVLHERSAEVHAKLIAVEDRFEKRIHSAGDGIAGDRLDVAERVQIRVANELVERGVELIAAALGGNVDGGA